MAGHIGVISYTGGMISAPSLDSVLQRNGKIEKPELIEKNGWNGWERMNGPAGQIFLAVF